MKAVFFNSKMPLCAFGRYHKCLTSIILFTCSINKEDYLDRLKESHLKIF